MKKIQIAIVDDEADFLEILALYIETESGFSRYEFHFFQSGSAYLKSVEMIDYLLTDINMPLMDGYELIIQTKSANPRIKFSVMSAYSDEESRNKAKALGSLQFFVKPLDFDIIRTHLEAVYSTAP